MISSSNDLADCVRGRSSPRRGFSILLGLGVVDVSVSVGRVS